MRFTILSLSLVFAYFFTLSACKNTPAKLEPNLADSIAHARLAPADLAAQFTAKKGKYGNDMGVLDEKSELNKRIKTLLGEEYGDFAERMAVQTPIRQEGSVWFFSSCASEACTYDESAVAYDTANKNLFVCIVRAGKASVKSEQEMPEPPILQAYIKDLE
jgi:hypothetical protein